MGAQQIIYESPLTGVSGPLTGFATPLSGTEGSAFVRGGFWVTPQFNAFIETDVDLYRYYSRSFDDANGYKVIGGLASDLIGLFRGEVYQEIRRRTGQRVALTRRKQQPWRSRHLLSDPIFYNCREPRRCVFGPHPDVGFVFGGFVDWHNLAGQAAG